MNGSQREQNPDVNSYDPDVDPGEGNGTTDTPSGRPVKRDDDVIPVPPDVGGTAPVEEPPGRDGPPVGDVDDSPKRIV